MKKKIACVCASALVLCMVLTGCNMGLGLGNFEFNHLYADTVHKPMCFNVEKWWDSGSGIEVDTKEAGVMFFAEGDYILVEDAENCPYCNGGEIEAGVPQNVIAELPGIFG